MTQVEVPAPGSARYLVTSIAQSVTPRSTSKAPVETGTGRAAPSGFAHRIQMRLKKMFRLKTKETTNVTTMLLKPDDKPEQFAEDEFMPLSIRSPSSCDEYKQDSMRSSHTGGQPVERSFSAATTECPDSEDHDREATCWSEETMRSPCEVPNFRSETIKSEGKSEGDATMMSMMSDSTRKSSKDKVEPSRRPNKKHPSGFSLSSDGTRSLDLGRTAVEQARARRKLRMVQIDDDLRIQYDLYKSLLKSADEARIGQHRLVEIVEPAGNGQTDRVYQTLWHQDYVKKQLMA
eukprot:TRINITY_DN75913_c0_g1_i1.p1 TRINITY_DN75913_c0_g1~~TRINITY_DN75913_c0_g1_i1.p1  ORF type:complete len:291 (+),score=56.37 TRINITY_DN75913_c0_g1_i1:96-968(+)